MSRRSSLQAQTQSKSEVLQWVSFVLGLKVTKLEQVRHKITAPVGLLEFTLLRP